ncbi:TonB-dependent receptor [Massilia genomosp. 1]|uniref:TonB-dependent siderophore receptor n=1 Tax=Massilia genomosp. 1 TaxID=2609280 RepID=A0ABX0MK89_9BURK|nr:TonB-dependent siderophore receptor [Massilia genomosp. 1]NHZ63212.1 TonB-dependent siderophore receptor [Massilia genomosp. 1]
MAMQQKRLAVIIALALPYLSVPALAQAQAELKEITVTATRDQDAGYNPASSTSATKIDAPLRDIPQTVNVVPLSVLRDQGARSLQDVLKAVPGIGLSHGDGQRDQVTIRSFTAIADQFVDGMRDDALYFRDLSNTEQVEIIKGPASVLYGRGSSGGLINRISKKPGINKNEVSLQAGSWNQRRAEIDVARADSASPLAFRVTGAVERADSYRDQQFLDREAFAPSVSLNIGSATKLLLQAEYLNDKRVTDFGVPSYRGKPVDVAAGTYYGAANAKANDYSEAEVKAFGFTLDHRINDAWTVRNALRHYHYTLDRNNTLAGSVDEKALTASLNRSNVRRDESGYFNQTELKQVANLAGMRHQLLYGVEIGKQEKDQLFRSQNNIARVNLFNPVAPVLPFTVSAAPSTDNLGVMKVASAYVQDMATLSAQWKALAGVRFDRFEQSTLERRAGQSNLSRVDRAWSPRAGLVYQPGETQSYFGSFSKSFQPSGESFALAANNAQIAPEETTNKEVGAKFDLFDGNATASVSLFRLERTNIKATDPTTNRLIPIGTQRSDGVELTFAGKLGDGWQLWSGYAYLDARAVSSVAMDAGQPVQGKRPTLTPVHSGNVWLTKTLGNGFGVGGGVNAVGERFANPGNTVSLPGYATIDAMAYYRQGKVDIQVNAMNLADRQYIVAGHGSNGNLNLPGAPRSVQVTARYAF